MKPTLRRGATVAAFVIVFAAAAAARAATPITVWNLGDSVTDGAGSAKHGEIDSGGLRRSMIEQLVKDGYDPTLYGSVKTEQPDRIPAVMRSPARIYHEGHNGFTIPALIGGVQHWLEHSPSNNGQPIRPQFVTVMIGTNDVGKHFAKAKDSFKDGAAGTPMDEATVLQQMGGDLRTLVTKVTDLRPDAHVIVSSIIPAYWAYGIDAKFTGSSPFPGKGAPADQTDYLNNHYVIAYNKYVKETLVPELARAGKHVSFVDIYPEFIGADKDGHAVILTKQFGDTTHPNTIGYDRIGKCFAKAIEAAAKTKR